jgi:hypothetical protein
MTRDDHGLFDIKISGTGNGFTAENVRWQRLCMASVCFHPMPMLATP